MSGEEGEDATMGGGGGGEVIGSAAMRPIFLGNLMPNYTGACVRAGILWARKYANDECHQFWLLLHCSLTGF